MDEWDDEDHSSALGQFLAEFIVAKHRNGGRFKFNQIEAYQFSWKI